MDCQSVDDAADLLRDFHDDVRLLAVEQDDSYAVLLRLDAVDDDARVFLSDGHAADEYPLAALFADELAEIGGDELSQDEDAPPARDSAPFGDPAIVEDLGTSATELLALCAREGTLPVDVLYAVSEKAGAGEVFEDLRG